MRVIGVGELLPEDIDAVRGTPMVLLVGTMAEVAAAAKHLFQHVDVVPRASPQTSTEKEKP